jgi:hypothetical protein
MNNEWSNWNLINLVLIFVNFYVAIWAFKRGDDLGGNINMMAVLLNGFIIASKLTA